MRRGLLLLHPDSPPPLAKRPCPYPSQQYTKTKSLKQVLEVRARRRGAVQTVKSGGGITFLKASKQWGGFPLGQG